MWLSVIDAGVAKAVTDWSEEQDYREAWSKDARTPPPQRRREFCFREAGVARFNDVVDEGFDEPEHEA